MDKLSKTDAEWRAQLSAEQYRVTRQHGTERPHSGEYDQLFAEGLYQCVCCGAPLFDSLSKFDAGCGWPSFFRPAAGAPVAESQDNRHGMRRVEVHCDRCGAHLGHVFDDGPQPTGLRYCINSVALQFAPAGSGTSAPGDS